VISNAKSGWTRILCDADFDRDGKQMTYLLVPHSRDDSAWGTVQIPLVIVKNGRGPGLLLTGGTHGDEYEGQIVLAELARSLQPDEIKGCVIIIPSLHMPACQAGARTSPIDGRDINRSFPGDAAGSFAQMLAHFVTNYLLPQVETNIDLHSGGRSLDCLPCTMSHLLDDTEILARTRALANAFGAPLHVMNKEVDGAFTFQSTAEHRGVISMSSELGGACRVSVEALAIARRGVRNAMVHLGIMAGTPDSPEQPTRYMTIRSAQDYKFAPTCGIYAPCFPLGTWVNAGQVLGYIHHIENWTMEPVAITSTQDGLLWCQRGQGIIAAGDATAVVVSDWST
jgi:N-alpha-acetyl-L-2,4-diaminobutyrate deacetylase